MLVKILVVLIVLLNRCESIDRNDLRPLSDTSLAKFHYIRDEPVIYPLLIDVDSYAMKTLPSKLVYIATSSLPNAGLGVFAARSIARLTYFGPYCCEKYNESTSFETNRYTWEIPDESENVIRYVDASQLNKSNWLRYVNCPNKLSQQNLVAFINGGDIYYLVVREITRGEELLVYYGNGYARKLGIDPKQFYAAYPQN